MDHPLVICPGADLDLERLVQQALDRSEACSIEDLIDDLCDIKDGVPVIRPSGVETANWSWSEPEVETETKRKVAPYTSYNFTHADWIWIQPENRLPNTKMTNGVLSEKQE